MIEITLDDVNGNQQKMLSKFKKKIRESRIILELKERKNHIPKKEKIANKKKKAKYKREMKKNEENELNSIF